MLQPEEVSRIGALHEHGRISKQIAREVGAGEALSSDACRGRPGALLRPRGAE